MNRPAERPADSPAARPFAREAYLFVFEALQKVQDDLAAPGPQSSGAPGSGPPGGGSRSTTGEVRTGRHITAAELCEGFRELAAAQFGGLAGTVLRQWGVRSTEDVGRIVFELVDRGELSKCDRDRPEDFAGLFDFETTFANRFDADLNAVALVPAR